MVIAAAALAASACASVGARPGQGGGRPADSPPPVTDPAPIVPGTLRPYQIRGRWYRPAEQPDYDEVGLASWYGDAFHGRPTATGEPFDMHALTAAHKTLPLPGLVEVTNLANGHRVVLRINDRGPFVEGRIIDLSRRGGRAGPASGGRRPGAGAVHRSGSAPGRWPGPDAGDCCRGDRLFTASGSEPEPGPSVHTAGCVRAGLGPGRGLP